MSGAIAEGFSVRSRPILDDPTKDGLTHITIECPHNDMVAFLDAIWAVAAHRGLWDTARDWPDDLVECAAEPCKWGVGVYCPLDENDPIWCSSCFARAVLARLDDQGKKIMDGRETGGSS